MEWKQGGKGVPLVKLCKVMHAKKQVGLTIKDSTQIEMVVGIFSGTSSLLGGHNKSYIW